MKTKTALIAFATALAALTLAGCVSQEKVEAVTGVSHAEACAARRAAIEGFKLRDQQGHLTKSEREKLELYELYVAFRCSG